VWYLLVFDNPESPPVDLVIVVPIFVSQSGQLGKILEPECEGRRGRPPGAGLRTYACVDGV
jgi:hypothetical protein